MPVRPKTHRPQGQKRRSAWVKKEGSVKRLSGRALQERNARILRRDPLCRMCLASGRVAEAEQVDHIKPLEHGGSEQDSNLQGLCVECHEIKSLAERGHAEMLPRDLDPPTKPLMLVCGPPAAGKTTYVAEHADPTDLVLDLDVMALEHGKPLYEMSFDEKRTVIGVRNARLASFCAGRTAHPRCWLIATAGSFKHRKYWSDLGAQVVPINPGAVVCKERIHSDTTRPIQVRGSRIQAVEQWC
jgi:5-methylcytosine-specific restriction endonuclease McrA